MKTNTTILAPPDLNRNLNLHLNRFSAAPEIKITSKSKIKTLSVAEMTGQPKYLADGRMCVLPVRLQRGKVYALWLNSEQHWNFKSRAGQSALPYLLIFETRK